MAGTTTVTSRTILEEPLKYPSLSPVGEKVVIDWTSDASGDVSGGTTIVLRGFAVKAVTNPDGTDIPTDNYDITLRDPDDTTLDSLGGLLADRDTSTTEEKYLIPTSSPLPVYLNGAYELRVANAGNAKKGKLILYMLNN